MDGDWIFENGPVQIQWNPPFGLTDD